MYKRAKLVYYIFINQYAGGTPMNKYELEEKIVEMIRMYAPAGTRFQWSTSRRAFGTFSYRMDRYTGDLYSSVIKISWPIASNNTWEVIKSTVIHEIAHANTPGHGHDRVWQRECVRLGGDGKRCYSSVDRGGEVHVPYKWTGTCPVCGYKINRMKRIECYHCNRDHLTVWTPYNSAA